MYDKEQQELGELIAHMLMLKLGGVYKEYIRLGVVPLTASRITYGLGRGVLSIAENIINERLESRRLVDEG